MKKINTERLLLRKLTLEDSNEVFTNWTSDFEVSKYVTWNKHETIEDTKDLMEYWINDYNCKSTFRWGIVEKESNSLIGVIDVIYKNEQYMTCEVGYCIGSKWWGKGYAS